MNDQQNLSKDQLEAELQKISDEVWSLAKESREDPQRLLSLLRTLELLHRQIREELFQPALPNTRHALYTILKDIEENGGWPYIQRSKIQQLCVNMLLKEKSEEATAPNEAE